ncbi:MAG: hypothetical protein KIS88_03735 [Anaerolineales bacterium]|nr:hypothetical protein [Anaerolineales bacterium]
MQRTQKLIIAVLALFFVVLFALFWLPNQVGSADMGMVLSFEPDEALPFPYMLNMVRPADSVKQALVHFISYEYYFYGFPHFAWSAVLMLPLQWLGQIQNTPLVMAVLRNFVSVLPMLAAILVLVYLHTKFRDYRALVLFAFLAIVPGIVQNNFWWHPDSLAIFFAMLTLFFLAQDDLRFGPNFYLAAMACGLSAQTKTIGVYFFLAILVYLWLGYRQRKRSWLHLLIAALAYLGVMAAVFFASNPILLYAPARAQYIRTLTMQSGFMADGFEVFYAKGLPEVTRMLAEHFGGWLLLVASTLAAVWAALRGPNRLLHILILAWVLPLAVYVFGFSIVKYQYWMPAALPLLSCLAVALPADRAEAARWWREQRSWALLAGLLLAVGVYGVVDFAQNSAARYREQLTRQQNNSSLVFYTQANEALTPLPTARYQVYADVNLYIPESAGWTRSAQFETLDHEYIGSNGFDILFLSQTRIWDYLNDDVVGIDAERFAASQEFYRDANAGELPGYYLVYREAFGLVFVNEALYQEYFAP